MHRNQTLGKNKQDSMFDCKNGFLQSEDKCDLLLHVVIFIFIWLLSCFCSNRSTCTVHYQLFAFFAFVCVWNGMLVWYQITWCQMNVMYSWNSCDVRRILLATFGPLFVHTMTKGSKQTWRFTTKSKNLMLTKNQWRMCTLRLHHSTLEKQLHNEIFGTYSPS